MGGGMNGEKGYSRIDPVDNVPIQGGDKKKEPGPLDKKYLDKNGQFLINQSGFDLVKHFEGLYLKTYIDPVGVKTIAYGRIVYPDGTKVKTGDTCTEQQAEEWLRFDLWNEGARYVRAFVDDDVEKELTENQFSALVSLTYNRGAGRFRDYIAPFINARDFNKAMAAMCSLNWAGSDRKYLSGLDRRRCAERALFDGKDWKKFKDLEFFRNCKLKGYKWNSI